MHVIATAGHVDHGKSTLIRQLTGMEPDRWEEERRRGLTIDLGFVWTDVAGQTFAFVDVPGHQRFVPTMLAGTGPVTAVLFVVAADGGWMPQSAEHLAAVDAVGIRHGLLAVTRCDLADPGPATREALGQLSRTRLGAVRAVRERFADIFAAPSDRAAAELINVLVAAAGTTPRLTDHDGHDWHVHYFSPGASVADHLAADCGMALGFMVVAGERERLRRCGAPGCGRAFVDLSRNRSRRYCSSRTCGNRLHVAAYRARRRES